MDKVQNEFKLFEQTNKQTNKPCERFSIIHKATMRPYGFGSGSQTISSEHSNEDQSSQYDKVLAELRSKLDDLYGLASRVVANIKRRTTRVNRVYQVSRRITQTASSIGRTFVRAAQNSGL